jgi:hypothetical protein
MYRVYPGEAPGECVIHLDMLSPAPQSGEDHSQSSLESALQVLRDEDFPAAEGCQHGAEHALDKIVVGRNEPLL